jgi:hypothetical protein
VSFCVLDLQNIRVDNQTDSFGSGRGVDLSSLHLLCLQQRDTTGCHTNDIPVSECCFFSEHSSRTVIFIECTQSVLWCISSCRWCLGLYPTLPHFLRDLVGDLGLVVNTSIYKKKNCKVTHLGSLFADLPTECIPCDVSPSSDDSTISNQRHRCRSWQGSFDIDF